jgi:4-hydroxymandelate oxidase
MVHHVKPPLAAPPADLRSLADYAARARSHERRGLAAHRGRLRRGRNLARQCPKPARWRLLPRALADLRGGSTALTLLGQRHAAPILLGPVAYQRLVHPDGEIATAQAAAATGTAMVVSTLASATLEAIAQASRQASRNWARLPAPCGSSFICNPRAKRAWRWCAAPRRRAMAPLC